MSKRSSRRLAVIFLALLTAFVPLYLLIFISNTSAQEEKPEGITAPKIDLRIAHLAPFSDTLPATAVDVKLDGTQILTAFQYLSSTTYTNFDEGEYLVEVFPTGSMTPAITATVMLTKNNDFTAIAYGGANGYDLTLATLLNDNSPPTLGNGKIRFGHLAPFDPVIANTAVEIRYDGGAMLAGPFFYGNIEATYMVLPAGEYDLEVTTVGGADVLVDLAPFTLNNRDILYALVVGDGTNQDTGVFVYPVNMKGYLLPTEQDPNLRVAHLAPFSDTLAATAVDVKLDGTQVLTAVQYLSSTKYFKVEQGEYLVEIFPSGTMTPAITATVILSDNEDYTAIAYGGANGYDLDLAALLDDNSMPASGKGKIRFGHLAPFDPVLANTEAEIRTDNGTLVAGPFFYEDIDTIYKELAAGDYDLEVTSAGGADVLIDLAPFTLNGGDILYALAVGDGTNQELGVFAYPTDLEGFLLPQETEFANLRIAHLAPFSDTLAATAVDVKLNGTQVLTAVQYLSSTTYIEVSKGQYLVEVFPTGTVTPAITATVTLSDNEDYTAIAYGGANGYDLDLAALLDDNSMPASGKGKIRFGHLAPFDPVLADTEAEIRTDNGTLVAGPFFYEDIDTIYKELAAGDYDLEVTSAGGADVLVDLAPFTLNEGVILYALAVGDGTNQELGVFAYPTDLEGFLLPQETEFANLRIAHLAPFSNTLAATAVDVKLNGTQVLTAVQYLSSTTYIEVFKGQYLVEVFPTGTMTPAITATVTLSENEDYTAIAYGGANGYGLDLAALLDDNSLPASGKGKIRFGHLAPFDPVLADTEAEIRTDSGTLVAGPFFYGDIDTIYKELAAGDYDLEVTSAGGADVLIDLAPFTLSGGDILYALAVGDGTNQELGVFAYPTDLEGFLLPQETEFAKLRVAHLAPFTDTLAATAVDVKLNGTQVLTAVQYLSSTTYIEVSKGQYLVEVFPTGTMTPAITSTVTLSENEDYTAIAYGGANGYDLDLAALLDDNSLPASGKGKIRFSHLAPFDPVLADTEAEIRTDSGTLVAGPFFYGDIDSFYNELAAGNYDLKVVAAGDGPVLINLAPFTLNAGDILYALAVGDGTNQDAGVFAYPTDLEGSLLPQEALYQLIFPMIFK